MVSERQKVWKFEWTTFIGNSRQPYREIVEVCERHSHSIMASRHDAVACGSYDGTCDYCERES